MKFNTTIGAREAEAKEKVVDDWWALKFGERWHIGIHMLNR